MRNLLAQLPMLPKPVIRNDFHVDASKYHFSKRSQQDCVKFDHVYLAKLVSSRNVEHRM